jgi:hypothetical protein
MKHAWQVYEDARHALSFVSVGCLWDERSSGRSGGTEGSNLMKTTVKYPEESPRWRVRGKEDFTADELALLQEKLRGWIQQAMPKSESKRSRHQFVMKSKRTGHV